MSYSLPKDDGQKEMSYKANGISLLEDYISTYYQTSDFVLSQEVYFSDEVRDYAVKEVLFLDTDVTAYVVYDSNTGMLLYLFDKNLTSLTLNTVDIQSGEVDEFTEIDTSPFFGLSNQFDFIKVAGEIANGEFSMVYGVGFDLIWSNKPICPDTGTTNMHVIADGYGDGINKCYRTDCYVQRYRFGFKLKNKPYGLTEADCATGQPYNPNL